MGEAFSWLMFIPAFAKDHNLLAVGHTWLVTLFLLLLAVMVNGRIRRVTETTPSADLVPDDRLTLRNIFELYVENILGMMEGLMGHDAHKYFWLIGTIFIYLFCSNMLGIIPGFLPPTENINTNLAVSLLVFAAYNVIGIKANGLVGYLKHFMGPIIWLAPFMVVVEGVSHLVRPASLAIRLFGNINGDHLALGIFSQVIPEIATPVLGLLVPIPFIGLGIFVSFIQAFVFSLLSTIYIAMATAHDH